MVYLRDYDEIDNCERERETERERDRERARERVFLFYRFLT